MATPSDALSNPAVTAVIGAAIGVVGGGIVGYLLGRHWRSEDRRLAHSRNLKDRVLVPWSRVQIYRQLDWRDGSYGFPRLAVDPHDLWEQPVFSWARSHFETEKPEAALLWSEVATMLEEEDVRVEHLKVSIRIAFEREVEREFPNRLKMEWHLKNGPMDVFFDDVVVHALLTELWNISQGSRNSPEFDLVSAPLGAGGAYVGSKVVYAGGMEFARVRRLQDAEPEAWARVFESTANGKEVREAISNVVTQDKMIQDKLTSVKKALGEMVQRVENGLPLEGKCELGF